MDNGISSDLGRKNLIAPFLVKINFCLEEFTFPGLLCLNLGPNMQAISEANHWVNRRFEVY